jgi:hypothetical protein
VPSDEVSTFAQLYVSRVAQDRKAGLLQPSFETLHAKGEAIRIIQDVISVCGSQVPASIIFAMTLLAYGCVSASLFVWSVLIIGRVPTKRGMKREVMLKHYNMF